MPFSLYPTLQPISTRTVSLWTRFRLVGLECRSPPPYKVLQMQLNAFFELASSKDVEVQRYFSMMLSNLASNEDLHEFLSSRACFQAVNSILLADSMETVVSALGFVLSVLRGARPTFINDSVIDFMELYRFPNSARLIPYAS